MSPNSLHLRSDTNAAIAAALTKSNWEHWSDREIAIQNVTDALDETVMWRLDRDDLMPTGGLLLRCSASTRHAIRIFEIAWVEILGNGWLRYGFNYRGNNEDRYVAPHFDIALSRECGVHHIWNGEWYFDEKTLHCRVCGVDGS